MVVFFSYRFDGRHGRENRFFFAIRGECLDKFPDSLPDFVDSISSDPVLCDPGDHHNTSVQPQLAYNHHEASPVLVFQRNELTMEAFSRQGGGGAIPCHDRETSYFSKTSTTSNSVKSHSPSNLLKTDASSWTSLTTSPDAEVPLSLAVKMTFATSSRVNSMLRS